MFGLLTHNHLSKPDYNDFKKNYCGNCQTIGKLYGQKERLLLNNDVVFLSELLACITNLETDFEHIHVNKCFRLPKDKANIPRFLQYSASVNVLLGYYKVIDNIEDSKYTLTIWNFLKRFQRKNFNKAKKLLTECGLRIHSIECFIYEQFRREATQPKFETVNEAFEFYSHQTGKITGEVFRKGATTINKPHLADILYSIGSVYGEIVYLIDAIKDYKKDKQNQSFNLLQLYNETGSQLDPNLKEQAYDYIGSKLFHIQDSLWLLPIPAHKISQFNKRLEESINSEIGKQTSCNVKETTGKIRSITDRYRYALNTSQLVSRKWKSQTNKSFYYSLLSVFVLLFFLVFPTIAEASQPDKKMIPHVVTVSGTVVASAAVVADDLNCVLNDFC